MTKDTVKHPVETTVQAIYYVSSLKAQTVLVRRISLGPGSGPGNLSVHFFIQRTASSNQPRNTATMKVLNLWIIGSYFLFSAADAGEAEFKALVQKMEQDLLDFVFQIESYHGRRCEYQTLASCGRSNHHETLSSLPNPKCYETDDLRIDVCNATCGSLWDDKTSTIRIPDSIAASTTNYFPRDPRTVEMICYSSFMDSYLQVKKAQDQAYWDNYRVRSPQAYFGSTTGALRIYPGRTSRTAGVYDPRNRPWYIAASSGPKNVILILDTSGTMQGRMVELRAAARQVINSLTAIDGVAIIAYATEAQKIGRQIGSESKTYVYTATQENKDSLLAEIDTLIAFGETNTYDAFDKAFEILEDSFAVELATECNTALLFLTDGRTTREANMTQEERYVGIIKYDES